MHSIGESEDIPGLYEKQLQERLNKMKEEGMEAFHVTPNTDHNFESREQAAKAILDFIDAPAELVYDTENGYAPGKEGYFDAPNN